MFINNRNAFSRKAKMVCFFGLFLLLSAAGCEVFASRGGQPSGGASSRVTIVYPQESAQFFVGDFVDIHAEISDPSGLTTSVLIANEEILRRDTFLSSVANGDLYQPWVPDAPGVYALQLILETSAGGQIPSNIVNVYVTQAKEKASEEPAEKSEEATEEEKAAEACPLPTATSKGYPFCRSGPGTAYAEVTNLEPGQMVLVTAVSSSGNWLRVEYSKSDDTCWVWRKLLEISGNTDCLPVSDELEKDTLQEVPEEEPDSPTHPTKDPGSGPTTS